MFRRLSKPFWTSGCIQYIDDAPPHPLLLLLRFAQPKAQWLQRVQVHLAALSCSDVFYCTWQKTESVVTGDWQAPKADTSAALQVHVNRLLMGTICSNDLILQKKIKKSIQFIIKKKKVILEHHFACAGIMSSVCCKEEENISTVSSPLPHYDTFGD